LTTARLIIWEYILYENTTNNNNNNNNKTFDNLTLIGQIFVHGSHTQYNNFWKRWKIIHFICFTTALRLFA